MCVCAFIYNLQSLSRVLFSSFFSRPFDVNKSHLIRLTFVYLRIVIIRINAMFCIIYSFVSPIFEHCVILGFCGLQSDQSRTQDLGYVCERKVSILEFTEMYRIICYRTIFDK